MDSHANNCDFFYSHVVAHWWPKVCCWGDKGITILLPLSTTLSINARSWWNVQYGCMSCFTSASTRAQLSVTYVVSASRCSSFCVASHMSDVQMHCWMSAHVSIALMLILMQ